MCFYNVAMTFLLLNPLFEEEILHFTLCMNDMVKKIRRNSHPKNHSTHLRDTQIVSGSSLICFHDFIFHSFVPK